MLVKTLLSILLFASLLFANSLSQTIDSLNQRVPYATKAQTIDILHRFENIYISSVVANDKSNIAKSLRGIIRCRKLLGMDTRTYQNELSAINKTLPKKSKISTLDRTKVSTSTISTKSKTEHKKVQKKSITHTRAIKSISSKENTLIIKFDKPLKEDDIFYFKTLTEDGYKSIYDIKAKLLSSSRNFKLSNIDKIKVKQNRKDLVRVVLQDKSMIYSKAFIRKGNLFIMVNKNPKRVASTVKKTTSKPPKKKENKIAKKEDEFKATLPTPKVTPPSDDNIYATGKIIVIDAGHGGHDSGAVGYKKHQEKVAVLKVAKHLKKLLQKKGYRVYMTREGDTFVKLTKRTKFANKKDADLFISIHANAAPKGKHLSMKGLETFFLSPARSARAKRVASKENSAASAMSKRSKDTLLDFLNRNKIIQSNKLAIDIQSGLLSATRAKFTSIKDGGVREAPFWVLVGAQMPAVLIEIGYITNPMEGDRLYNPFYQKTLAKGIYIGINNYFAHNK